jgi:hypothetical protein
MAAVRSWDAFAVAEAEVRALVADPRWQELGVPARAEAIAARVLVTPDGDRWLFGAHARWHLHDPADGRWHLAPPPSGARVRRAGHAAAVLPARVIPRGPDFAAEPGSTQAFVGPDVPAELTERVRVLVRAAGRRSETDFPLTAFGAILAGDVPSTVAAVWGTIMWCAYAPAFDGNERLLTVFGEYLRRPLPGDEWVRWVPAPPLLDLVTLVAERLRAGRPRQALRLAAVMADTAQILLADPRFRPRALALLTMVEPALTQPGLDERAAQRGDEPVRQAWLERCPPRLARAVLAETDPGAHFSHTVYELVEALGFTADPPRAAATLLADLSDSRGVLPGRLDHRLRHAYDELSRAGLTGTSAGETTQPDGFPVLGPSQPLPPAPRHPAASHGDPRRPLYTAPHPGPHTGLHASFPTGPRSGPHTGAPTGGHPGPHTGGPYAGAPGGPHTGAPYDPTGSGPPAGSNTSARPSGGGNTSAGPPAGGNTSAGPSGGHGDAGAGRSRGFGTLWGATGVPAAARKALEALARMPHQPVTSGFEIEPPDRATAAGVLGAAYAVGLAWRGVTGANVPEHGFAGQVALVMRIVHERDDNHM